MKVVLSADGTEEGAAARQWCASHLDAATSVIAVVGINQIGEFVLGLPPFDVVNCEPALDAQLQRDYCRGLSEAGLACEARIADHSQARAVVEVAAAEHADLIVIGKRPHGRLADAMLGETASHIVHRPPCPVVVVPTGPDVAHAGLASTP
jgi:nucleotide-binding universal stress UspA family protein